MLLHVSPFYLFPYYSYNVIFTPFSLKVNKTKKE